MNRGGDPVVGKCFACGLAVRRSSCVWLRDQAVGVRRKLHRGACAERFEVQNGPTIEGGKG